MSLTISLSYKPITTSLLPSSTTPSLLPHFSPLFKPFSSYSRLRSTKPRSLATLCKSSEKEIKAEPVEEDEEVNKLPEKKKPLYAHSLGCIELWLRQLGFCQRNGEDPAAWVVEKRDWHANLNLDVTDLSIRYLKTGPGNLEKDVERRFSYALSREDIENAILGGP